MILIKKQHYINFLRCNKAFLHSLFNKQDSLYQENVKNVDEFDSAKNLAYQYFDNTFDASGNNISISIDDRVNLTEQFIHNEKIKTISNCVFLYRNLFCNIDIIRKNNDKTFSIYKIKSCTDIKKNIDHYYDEISFQTYILEKNNLKIKDAHIIHINKNYVRNGEIEIKKLFLCTELCKKNINENMKKIEENIFKMIEVLQKKDKYYYCDNKNDCYGNCVFFNVCYNNLPQQNITEINGINKQLVNKFIKKNIITFSDLKENGISFKDYRKQIQVDTCLSKKKFFVNKTKLKNFLKTITYPAYYLDFETINEAIPPFNGAKPYEQFPFQYSLHIEEKKFGKITHKNFLGNKIDCSYELAKKLIKDIPENACIISYNAIIEKNIIKKLSQKFPDLKKKLLSLTNNFVDLLYPFKKGIYYDIKQGKSNSIKEVSAALCPQTKHNYQKLVFVHNGLEASNMFKDMLNSSKDEKYKKRSDMLKYCSLDTLNMIKIIKILHKKSI
ncbi:MAG: DUF2779 domain-containing protein [Bacilli bacterium]|nr:DUF2779 domain-containing protein [Bacilli bacterium]